MFAASLTAFHVTLTFLPTKCTVQALPEGAQSISYFKWIIHLADVQLLFLVVLLDKDFAL